MKFFDYFDKLGMKFDRLSSSWNSLDTRKNTLSNARGTHTDVGSIDEAAIAEAEKYARDIDQVEKSMKGLRQEDELWKKLNTELTRLKFEARNMEKKFFDEKTRLNKSLYADEKRIEAETLDRLKKTKRSYDSATEAERVFQNDLTKLTRTLTSGGMEMEEYDKKVSALYDKKMRQQGMTSTIKTVSGNIFSGAEAQTSGFINGIGNGFGMLLKTILPEFAILIDAIVALFKEALKQIFDASKMFIDIQRKTSGIVTREQLGYNQVGMTDYGRESIQHKTTAANVSMDQYKDAIGNLFTGPMGQVAGMRDNLATAGKDIDNFGIASARMTKLWNTDITKAVQGLTMGYNLSLKEATETTQNFSWAAYDLGLNTSTAMANLEKLANGTGKYYFKSKENMQNLALLATKLGVSVDDLMEGTSKMNSMTDLFTQQQQLAALGLTSTANSAAKVYALRQTGEEDKAIALQQTSLAKDLVSNRFIDKNGNVTKQGIDTFKANGYSEEMVKAAGRMARDAKAAGVSFEAIADASHRTAEEQRRIMQVQYQNATLTEKLGMIYNQLIQPFVDMIKGLIGPTIVELIDGLWDLGNALEPVFKDFIGAFSLIGTVIGYVVGSIMSVLTVLAKIIKVIWGGLQWIVMKVVDFVKWLGFETDEEQQKEAGGKISGKEEQHSTLYRMLDLKGNLDALGNKLDDWYDAITGNTDALKKDKEEKIKVTDEEVKKIQQYQRVTWGELGIKGTQSQREFTAAKAQLSSITAARKSSEAMMREAFQNNINVNVPREQTKQTTVVQTHVQVDGVLGNNKAVVKKR